MSSSLPASSASDPATAVTRLCSQYPAGLLGVPREGLRLSWQVQSSDPEARQLGYQVRWHGDSSGETAAVDDADSIGIGAPGGALAAGRERAYSIRIATATGWTAWSEDLVVEAALERSAAGEPANPPPQVRPSVHVAPPATTRLPRPPDCRRAPLDTSTLLVAQPPD